MLLNRRWVWSLGAITLCEATLIHLGRTYGSTTAERSWICQAIVPADFIMSGDMLRGIKTRVESTTQTSSELQAPATRTAQIAAQ